MFISVIKTIKFLDAILFKYEPFRTEVDQVLFSHFRDMGASLWTSQNKSCEEVRNFNKSPIYFFYYYCLNWD